MKAKRTTTPGQPWPSRHRFGFHLGLTFALSCIAFAQTNPTAGSSAEEEEELLEEAVLAFHTTQRLLAELAELD